MGNWSSHLRGITKTLPRKMLITAKRTDAQFRGENSLTKAVSLRRHWKTELVSLGGKLHRWWSQGDLGATCSLATAGLWTNYLTSLTPQFLSSVEFSNTIYATGLLQGLENNTESLYTVLDNWHMVVIKTTTQESWQAVACK